MKKILKCRSIPTIKFPVKGEPSCKLTDRDNFEPMTDEKWFEWSGEPITVCLSPDTGTTRIHITVPIKPTPIMIYAKEIYFISYIEYKLSKLIDAAQIDLGIDDESKLILAEDRKKNFQIFEKERFNTKDPWGDQIAGIFKKGSSAYDHLKLYSQTRYGSLMIDRINKYKGKFTVYLILKGSKKFQAMGASHHIRLPVDFPELTVYPFTDQKIDPLAVIHHEFEHTIFGKLSYEIGSLQEEIAAVKNYENPVRILNGYEPRYVYYQRATDTSASVFDYKNTKSGGVSYDPLDPRVLK